MRLLAVIAVLTAAAAPVWADDPDPVRAAQQYVEVLFNQDVDAAAALLCAADRDTLDADALRARLDQISALEFTADLSALDYTLVHARSDWAQVSVAGDVWIEVDGLDEPVLVAPADLRIGTLWPVIEEDEWKVCVRPPARALPDLDPDAVAWAFLDAAFGGDYATAHSVICQARADAFTETQYEAAFADFLTGRTQIALDETTFDIVSQDESEAIVTLGGTITLTLSERPGAVETPAEELGWGPIHLVYEDGWKICPAQSFER